MKRFLNFKEIDCGIKLNIFHTKISGLLVYGNI